jgi:hypothetical protein
LLLQAFFLIPTDKNGMPTAAEGGRLSAACSSNFGTDAGFIFTSNLLAGISERLCYLFDFKTMLYLYGFGGCTIIEDWVTGDLPCFDMD